MVAVASAIEARALRALSVPSGSARLPSRRGREGGLRASTPWKAGANKTNARGHGGSAQPIVIPRSRASVVTRVKSEKDDLDQLEDATKKYGLEYGLFKTLTDKTKPEMRKKDTARGLLAKYGSAYLITSITFALFSFALCYALVSAGVDVSALLGRLGIEVSVTSERVGKIAIAYAAHKAASPIRFPPTVALTPVVAKWLGKNKKKDE